MASITNLHKPALFLLTDPKNPSKILVRIGTDFSLEMDDSISKNEVLSNFWHEIAKWNNISDSDSINNKALLILLFAKVKKLISDIKISKDDELLTKKIMEVSDVMYKVEKLFY